MNHSVNKSQKTVGLVGFDTGHISGLSRYAGTIFRQMEFGSIKPILVRTTMPMLVRWVKPLFLRLGLDIESFLYVYPLSLSKEVQNCDLIHLTHRTQSTVLLRRPSVPVVVTAHDIIHFIHRDDAGMTIYRHRIHKWFDYLSLRLLKRADAVIASSEYTREMLITKLGLTPCKVHCIHLGVDSEWFRLLDVPDSFLNSKGLDRNTTYILHVGTEEARKNIPALLRAFAQIHAEFPNCRLLRVGKPLYTDQRAKILKEVEEMGLRDRVLFFDDVTDQDLVYFYNLASVFVFPSLAEGFGFPVLEAMACGTPVVCSNTTSLPELVGDAAIMVSPTDSTQIASSVGSLLRDEDYRLKLGNRGRQWSVGITWSKTGDATLAIYQSLLTSNFHKR